MLALESKVMFPPFALISACTLIPPTALSKMFPVEVVKRLLPSVLPSKMIMSPANAVNIMEPLAALIKSLCAASITGVTAALLSTRFTESASIVVTVIPVASLIKKLPLLTIPLNVMTLISSALSLFPTPVMALRRNPPATTSMPVSLPSKICPPVIKLTFAVPALICPIVISPVEAFKRILVLDV